MAFQGQPIWIAVEARYQGAVSTGFKVIVSHDGTPVAERGRLIFRSFSDPKLFLEHWRGFAGTYLLRGVATILPGEFDTAGNRKAGEPVTVETIIGRVLKQDGYAWPVVCLCCSGWFRGTSNDCSHCRQEEKEAQTYPSPLESRA